MNVASWAGITGQSPFFRKMEENLPQQEQNELVLHEGEKINDLLEQNNHRAYSKNDIRLNATSMPRLRDNAIRYMMTLPLETPDSGREDVKRTWEPFRNVPMYYISKEIYELAVDVLNTTGIQKEWLSYIPKDSFILWEKLDLTLDGGGLQPLTNDQFQDATGVLSSSAMSLDLYSPIKAFWLFEQEPGNYDIQPFVDGEEVGERVETNIKELERCLSFLKRMRRKNLVNETSRTKSLEKKAYSDLTYMKSYRGISTTLLPPILPSVFGQRGRMAQQFGYSDEQTKRIMRDAAQMVPHTKGKIYRTIVCLVAAVFALSRQERIAENVRILGDGSGQKQSSVNREVNVVRLRQIQPHDVQRENVPHPRNCRWIVSGHFRHQPYGPQSSLRKVIWIAPYIAGPVDKPLHIRERVTAIVR